MRAYYNENDPYAAQWLRNLIDRGLIAPGDVDDRSIEDVQGKDLDGYCQCHFFAGIAGWSLALRLAGWPDDRPVWTGSCPCQDFSLAGKQAGFEGERDMWPAWHRLIKECRPDELLGEQVDDSPEWYDRLADDLEALDYACGAVVVPACAAGAIHERQRLWIAADSGRERGARLEQVRSLGASGSRRACGAEDLQLISDAPFVAGDRWPQPLIRQVDDGIPGRMALIHGYGNAIDPRIAAEFIKAFMESTPCR
jgi:DNA (cytosine-5)-methyltransferase 1